VRLRSIYGTSSFRLALLYAGLTGVSFALLFAVIFWSTARFMRHQIDDSVTNELNEILSDARARLPVQSAAGVDLTTLNAQIGVIDATLVFARRQFNDAVNEYNAATRQFPTGLLVGLFGFRGAGTL